MTGHMTDVRTDPCVRWLSAERSLAQLLAHVGPGWQPIAERLYSTLEAGPADRGPADCEGNAGREAEDATEVSVVVTAYEGHLLVWFDAPPAPDAAAVAAEACRTARRTCEACGRPGTRSRRRVRPDADIPAPALPTASTASTAAAAHPADGQGGTTRVLCRLHRRLWAYGVRWADLVGDVDGLLRAPEPARALLLGDTLGPVPFRTALAQCARATTVDPEFGWLSPETLAAALTVATRDQFALCTVDDLAPFLADPDGVVREAALTALSRVRVESPHRPRDCGHPGAPSKDQRHEPRKP